MYYLALDQGTTSVRSILYNSDAQALHVCQLPITMHYPQPGWVEQDPEELYQLQLNSMHQVVSESGISWKEIAGIGITNQRETTVVWNKNTGKPMYSAIVWQDRRTSDFCNALQNDHKEAMVKNKTGLKIDAYFSASKIRWIRKQLDIHANEQDLVFGTVDSWIIWNLTGGNTHATDPTNASRTMLFDIHKQKWDSELCELFEVPSTWLPEIRSSTSSFGVASDLPAHIPIVGVAGDQQSAMVGHGCFNRGDAKNTYGTGCFMLMNTGSEAVASQHGLLTILLVGKDGRPCYGLEGSVFMAGAVVQWLRDSLGLIQNSSDSESLATSVSDTGGVFLVPAFAGLGSPYWDMYARASIQGMSRYTTKAHIVRAGLESIAFQTAELLYAMQQDTHLSLKELRVDGGACKNNFLMQFQSDLLQSSVSRPWDIEATAKGAAFLCMWGLGHIHSSEIRDKISLEKQFEPAMDPASSASMMKYWKKAVQRSLQWVEKS